MQKTITELPEIKLLGISCRTNNTSEMNISTAKIAPTIQKYFQQASGKKFLIEKIQEQLIVFIRIMKVILPVIILILLAKK